jgi:VanZ family protein
LYQALQRSDFRNTSGLSEWEALIRFPLFLKPQTDIMSSVASTEDRDSFRSAISRYLPLIGWMGFISLASSASFSASNTSSILGPLLKWLFPSSPEWVVFIHFLVRKLAHFLEYAILGLLAARAFRGSPRETVRFHWFAISACLIIIYALLDEYRQSFVPSRTGSIFDSFIDISGGVAALLVVRWRRRKANQSG